jgi:hypothetical protein
MPIHLLPLAAGYLAAKVFSSSSDDEDDEIQDEIDYQLKQQEAVLKANHKAELAEQQIKHLKEQVKQAQAKKAPAAPVYSQQRM